MIKYGGLTYFFIISKSLFLIYKRHCHIYFEVFLSFETKMMTNFIFCSADVSTYFSSISSNVIVTSQGNVTWLSMVIFKSSCSINVRYFPFDEQNCSMTFASWTYDGFHINLILNTHEGDISNYIPNSEWHLHKLYVDRKVVFYSCCAEPYPDITFYIHILRRPLFYIFNMVMPCIMITLVALLGFYIPSDSGNEAYTYFLRFYLPTRCNLHVL